MTTQTKTQTKKMPPNNKPKSKLEFDERISALDTTDILDAIDPSVNETPADDTDVEQEEISVVDVMTDDQLFGRFFQPRWSWRVWIAFLTAVFGLPMRSPKARERFEKFTARTTMPTKQFKEAWLICGRRAGKSRIAALVAIYLACFRDYAQYLAPGERGTVMVIAADRKQARVIFRYIEGMIDSLPFLKNKIESRRADSIDFNNFITIEVHTANFRAVRGYSLIAAICDEIAFWRNEDSANPDEEILNAIKPGLATIPKSMLICLSSPWARRGAIWKAFKKHYGRDDANALVWNAESREMNPSLDNETVEEAYEDDADKAAAEWGGQFRKDVETYVTQDILDNVIVSGRKRMDRSATVGKYFAFVDPSGGTKDSMTLAIAHRELEFKNGKQQKRVILDRVEEVKAPFDPTVVVEEFANVIKEYGLSRVTGDHYAGEWPTEAFKKHGVLYDQATFTKSEYYSEFLPQMNSAKVELLDHGRLRQQLLGLERLNKRGGKERIDHAPGGHDDVANAVAGVCVNTYGKKSLGCTWGKAA